jgi:FMN phosphatase YigB (HAD superfamily)
MTEITTLLFDIGDVLIDIDWQRGYKKVLGHIKDETGRDLTLEEITEKLHPGPYGSIWDDFGMNKMTRAEFLNIAAEKTGYKGDLNLFENALKQLFEPLPERIKLLNKLIAENKYTVALVSDTTYPVNF